MKKFSYNFIGVKKMNRIKDLREDLDMKQSELAEIINTTRATISDYETEKTEPKKDVWIKLAEFFGVSTDYLMGKTNNPNNDNFTEGMEEEDIKELEKYKELLKIKRQMEKNKKTSTLINEN